MKVLSKIKNTFRNPAEQQFLKNNLKTLETQQNKQELIKFFVENIPRQISSTKKCSFYDFMSLMDKYKEGLPKMSDNLKNMLKSITYQELKKEFESIYS